MKKTARNTLSGHLAGIRSWPLARANPSLGLRRIELAALSSFKFYRQFKFAYFLFISLSNTNLVSSFLGQLLIENHTARTTIILVTKRRYNIAASHDIGRQRLDRDFHRLTCTRVNAIGFFPSVRLQPPNLAGNPRLYGQAFLGLHYVREAQGS